MKICMLVSNSIRKDPRVQREALSAYNAKIEVLIIGCIDKNYSYSFLKGVPYSIKLIKSINIINAKRGVLKKINSIFSFLYMTINFINICLIEKPNIIHANDFDTLIAAYVVSIVSRCKVVYDSHEIFSEQDAIIKINIVKIIIEIIELYIIKRIDIVISVSNSAAERLAKKYNINKPAVITNTSFFVYENELEKKDKIFSVLYQGIISKNRGYEEFVKSAKYIDNNIKLIVRGYGPTKKEIEKVVEDSNLQDKVEFVDPVEIRDLIIAASKAYIGVVLTKPVSGNFKFTVSNKIFEYVQARIPVILSDVPEHRYLNNKYSIGIIINIVTPENIADTINYLKNNVDVYNKYRNNVKNAAKELCWEVEEKKLIEIYKSI